MRSHGPRTARPGGAGPATRAHLLGEHDAAQGEQQLGALHEGGHQLLQVGRGAAYVAVAPLCIGASSISIAIRTATTQDDAYHDELYQGWTPVVTGRSC